MEVLTNGRGRVIARPSRKDYELGLEGDIAFMRAFHVWKDDLAKVANDVFARGLAASLKRMRRRRLSDEP